MVCLNACPHPQACHQQHLLYAPSLHLPLITELLLVATGLIFVSIVEPSPRLKVRDLVKTYRRARGMISARKGKIEEGEDRPKWDSSAVMEEGNQQVGRPGMCSIAMLPYPTGCSCRTTPPHICPSPLRYAAAVVDKRCVKSGASKSPCYLSDGWCHLSFTSS